ncbi:methyltransferase [Streptomyces sp. NPDC003395]
MGRLTKQQAKLHQEACALIDLDRDLTEDEKDFVLTNWQEAATATHGLDGAYFTPEGLARALSIEVGGDRVIDLCAGIGRLAYGCRDLWGRRWNNQPSRQIVCVEKNPDYVKVGRKILPEAQWICADVLDLPGMNLGHFDTAISNPPFGAIKRVGNGPDYTGSRFEYHVIAVASTLATFGAFIIPQTSAPFRYSGERCYRTETDSECERFQRQTGIAMGSGAGCDTSIYAEEWHGVSPRVEIVVCDFTEPLEQEQSAPASIQLQAATMPRRETRTRSVVDLALPEEQLAFDLPDAS